MEKEIKVIAVLTFIMLILTALLLTGCGETKPPDPDKVLVDTVEIERYEYGDYEVISETKSQYSFFWDEQVTKTYYHAVHNDWQIKKVGSGFRSDVCQYQKTYESGRTATEYKKCN